MKLLLTKSFFLHIIQFAFTKNVTLDTPKELVHSMPRRLEKVVKIKAGILVTNYLNDEMKSKPKKNT